MRYVAIALALLFVSSLAWATPQDVARSMFPKTVMIITQDQEGRPLAIGSGFVIKPGFIVSNFHVVEGAGNGFVKFINDKSNYKILGVAAKDELRDLVLLSVDGVPTQGAPLSQRASIEVGETVFAIGNPRGLEGTFSQGIVSSVRSLDDFTLLQITAPISPGSSGGPIADDKGQVVGVAVATFRGGQNLNFAIPVKYVADLEKRIEKTIPLSDATPSKKRPSLFSKLDTGKSTDGVKVSKFLWTGDIDGTLASVGAFTVSVKNALEATISDVHESIPFLVEIG